MARRRRKPRRESGGLGACPQFLTLCDRFRRNHKEIQQEKKHLEGCKTDYKSFLRGVGAITCTSVPSRWLPAITRYGRFTFPPLPCDKPRQPPTRVSSFKLQPSNRLLLVLDEQSGWSSEADASPGAGAGAKPRRLSTKCFPKYTSRRLRWWMTSHALTCPHMAPPSSKWGTATVEVAAAETMAATAAAETRVAGTARAAVVADHPLAAAHAVAVEGL